MSEKLNVDGTPIYLRISEGRVDLIVAREIIELDADARALLRQHIDTAGLIATEQQAAIVVTPGDPHCPYKHAHTRDWCGYPICRKS